MIHHRLDAVTPRLTHHYEQILVTLHEGTDAALNERLQATPHARPRSHGVQMGA